MASMTCYILKNTFLECAEAEATSATSFRKTRSMSWPTESSPCWSEMMPADGDDHDDDCEALPTLLMSMHFEGPDEHGVCSPDSCKGIPTLLMSTWDEGRDEHNSRDCIAALPPGAWVAPCRPQTLWTHPSAVVAQSDLYETEGQQPCWSAGSAGHASGECKPCGFYWSRKGCGNGEACRHCHLCPKSMRQEKSLRGRDLKRHSAGKML